MIQYFLFQYDPIFGPYWIMDQKSQTLGIMDQEFQTLDRLFFN